MSTYDESVNDPSYVLGQLSDVQRKLLMAAFSAQQYTVVLTRDQVPSATGLERRGLVVTARPHNIYTGRAKRGTQRTMRLTVRGVGAATALYEQGARPEAVAPRRQLEAVASGEDVALWIGDVPHVLAPDEARELAEQLVTAAEAAEHRRRLGWHSEP